MKQLIIFNLCPEEIKYAVSDTDLSEFNGTYINCDEDEDKVDRLNKLLYTDDGKDRLTYVELESIDMTEIDSAVEIGFML